MRLVAQVVIPIIVSRWFHFAAVIVAIGGTVFLRFLLHPSIQAALPGETGGPLRDLLLRRWTRVLHGCIGVLILSGTYNAIVQLPRHVPAPGQAPVYHMVFGLKLMLVLGLFFIAIAVTGRSQTFEPMRRNRPFWLAVNTAIAAAIVLLSNILKNIPPSS